MTKKQLEKLKKLNKEAEHLSRMLKRSASSHEMVIDTAKDYRTGYPHNITIAGYGQHNFPELQQKYYEKLQHIQEEISIIENWLDSVPDPEMRDILRMQYVNGLTQEQIADELGYSVITIKRRLRKFWKDDTE